jgi:DNA polymerase (family 10)
METAEIAHALKLTAQLMELHNDNPFKVKSLSNAAFKLDKTDINLSGKTLEELALIEGIGKSIAQKIIELQSTGTLKELEELVTRTPAGVIEMLGVKGIGPKKVGQLWKELGVESVGELLYACYENRLIDLKGFGAKTQEQVKKAIEFRMANAGKYLYASVEEFALKLVELVKKKAKTDLVSLTGEMRRRCEIIEKVEVLVACDGSVSFDDIEFPEQLNVEIIRCGEEEYYKRLFETTGSGEHCATLQSSLDSLSRGEVRFTSEEAIYEALGMQYIEPELRESISEIDRARQRSIPKLVELKDLRGILHNHSTYSDGINTLREMSLYCKENGYEYFGICDHSQSAFYASGLKADKVMEQQAEIDQLNKELGPFRVFKGIESDILNDGSLDYPEEILRTFDFIVASIHSNLKMDKAKATARLIKAIENPYTTMLGHMTGRLLLSRQGYPVDHEKVIDACAANNVVIELNAHPYRLDMDWRWIPYCLEKGVMISINPDAHHVEGFSDMHYGVLAARKGGLPKEMCFNSLSLQQVEEWFAKKKALINC